MPSASATTAPADILIIDDEVQIRRLLRLTLEGAGHRVREAATAALGLNEAATLRPDAIILDLGLPDADGLDVLCRIREWTTLPILILSVRDQETQKIAALDAGADDYLTKPFGGGELLARMRVLLRRAASAGSAEPAIASFGDAEVDFTTRRVTRAGEPVALTPKEYELLRILLRHRGKVVTHTQLLRELWGPANKSDQTHALRVHMTHLRQKLEPEPARPVHLRTEAGIGYRFTD